MTSAHSPIAIIGAGNVGKALGTAFVRAGERIVYGVRDIEKAPAVMQQAPILPVADAIASCSTVVLAVPYPAALDIAASISDWQGRIVIDVTNPVILPDHSGLLLGTTTSGAEQIAGQANGARIVKAFSCIFPEIMEKAAFPAGKVFMPICGDDADAVETIVDLANRMGLDGVKAGGLATARYIEPFTMLNVAMLFAGAPRGFAFTKLSRTIS